MQLDKRLILTRIIEQLSDDLKSTEQAVAVARDTATHPDALGSSRYETAGLEASYLAQGQGMRLLEIERALGYFSRLEFPASKGSVAICSLVELHDESGAVQYLWLAPEAGGLKVEQAGRSITVVTPKSPLGAALIGRESGEVVEVHIGGCERSYAIEAIA